MTGIVQRGSADEWVVGATRRPLDWVEFRARHYPGQRPRHDFQAVAAYGAYRRGFDGAPAPEGPDQRLRRVAVEGWEDEGGSVPKAASGAER